MKVFAHSRQPAGSPLASGTPSSRTDIAEILFTSGTTSEPRGVVLTHGNFLANLEPIETGMEEYRKYEKWFHPLRFVSLVPLSHVFGQFMSLFVPPLLGATVVFENSPHPKDILRTIRRDPSKAEMTEIDLNQLLGETQQSWSDMARDKWKLTLQLELETEGSPTILGDRSHLQQALENLLSNAMKYSPENRDIVVEVTRDGQYGVIRVTDRGVGIPACIASGRAAAHAVS